MRESEDAEITAASAPALKLLKGERGSQRPTLDTGNIKVGERVGNERSFLTSPQQALDHINDMRLRGFYFPINLENLLVHMIENQRNSRELVAIYNNDGRSMPPRI